MQLVEFECSALNCEDLIMSKRLYVGNMSYSTTQETLASLFSSYGDVISVNIIVDRDTSQSKGFGFVEMDDAANCDKAISELAGKEVDGRKIRVNYAEEKKAQDRSNFNRNRASRRFDHNNNRRRNGEY